MADMPERTPPKAARSPRVVSIGAAAYDLFIRTGDALKADMEHQALLLPVGGKIRIQEVIETCGGGAANTSVGLRRLGCVTGFCGVTGSDQWGQRILENFAKEGVDPSPATVVEGETSSFSVILNTSTGERVILYATGANAHLHDANFDKDAVAAADWVFFNHIHESSCIIQDDLIEVLRANRTTGLSWNPGGRQLKQGMHGTDNAGLLARTTLLFLNKEEALAFTGKATVESAIKALLTAGVSMPCVSDGKHGCTASDGRNMYYCPVIPNATVVDTTGAGDAFGTGATWAILQGFDLPTALKTGTINATSVLSQFGAQAGLLTDIDMRQRMESTTLSVAVRPL